MSLIFRPVNTNDLDDIYDLAVNAGFGMTTLCKDRDELKKKIDISLESFAKQDELPKCEYYLFVLEDINTKRVVGTSAIEAAIGYHQPWYTYRLSKVSRVCQQLDKHLVHDVLVLTNDMHGYSELGTLYLHPDYRKDGIGVFLSRARFMFMANFLTRFSDFIVAEMRGVSDESGRSPFWDSLGKHFFQIPFVEADELSGRAEKQFIADLLPHNPIYTILLSEEAQAVIGEPHPSTKPAMNILKKEGFRNSHYVDIFDAGPTLKVCTQDIKTIQNAKRHRVVEISDDIVSKRALISNDSLDFCCVLEHVSIDGDTCIVSSDAAKKLNKNINDNVRIALF